MSNDIDIVLVNPFPKSAYGINEATIEPPLGLAYLSSYLERYGFICKIIDANALNLTNEKVLELINKFKPKVIGISTNVVTSDTGNQLSQTLKMLNNHNIVILGGPFPSSLPEKVIRNSQADAIVVGEGEITLLEIMSNLKNGRHLFKDVRGTVYQENEKITFNVPRELIENLDELPFPSYHLLPALDCYKSRSRKKPVASILTSRGCPFKCVYCNCNIFGKKYRKRSAENVISEIDYLMEKYRIKQLDIMDDNFTLDRERTNRLLDLLIQRNYNLLINIQNGVRVDNVDENLIKKMKKAGVFKLSIGIESGDLQILNQIKKGIKLQDVANVISWAKKNGIIVYGNFMLGLPGDTPETMQRTIDFAKNISPHIANFMITIPFPGTELYELVLQKGKLIIDTSNGIDFGFYAGEVFYELNETKSDIVKKYYKKAYRDFYSRLPQIWRVIQTIRSPLEFRWTLEAFIAILKGFVFKKKYRVSVK